MVYHICNKSIADFVVFNNKFDFLRVLLAIRYYQIAGVRGDLSTFIKLNNEAIGKEREMASLYMANKKIVSIIAYCIMPTHLHILLEELTENGVSRFIGNVLNSYTRYFNSKYKRKGPLWEGRSKKIPVKTDEQLLHSSRYIHLNPVTAYLCDKPEEWPYSSYREYTQKNEVTYPICDYGHLLNIKPSSYKKFVEDGIEYQRELAKLKTSWRDLL